jgi:hypothetical protein
LTQDNSHSTLTSKMSTVTESMTETMTDISSITVSKAVQKIGNPDITSISERIVGTQTLLDMHERIRDNYKRDLKRLGRTANNSLLKGMPAIQASLAHVDQSLEIQRKIVDETDEMAKFARELLELIEQRQAAIRNMVENA